MVQIDVDVRDLGRKGQFTFLLFTYFCPRNTQKCLGNNFRPGALLASFTAERFRKPLPRCCSGRTTSICIWLLMWRGKFFPRSKFAIFFGMKLSPINAASFFTQTMDHFWKGVVSTHVFRRSLACLRDWPRRTRFHVHWRSRRGCCRWWQPHCSVPHGHAYRPHPRQCCPKLRSVCILTQFPGPPLSGATTQWNMWEIISPSLAAVFFFLTLHALIYVHHPGEWLWWFRSAWLILVPHPPP